MNAKVVLFVALVGFTLYYLVNWYRLSRASKSTEPVQPTPGNTAIGFVTNFFDTLGIGSFATTTSIWKFFKMIDDRVIPGTLNVGHTLPTVAQAFIFILVIDVDIVTLIALIAAAVLGSWLGAGVVAKWPRRKIQIGMGAALLAAALLFVIKNLDEMRGTPVIPGGDALGLSGALLMVGIVGNFVLGALMTLGIGLYAPCLIMISLLGMAPTAAFPIMMGSCAFLMPVGSVRFIREGSYDRRTAIGLALGGIPAALIAGLIVKSMSLTWVRWLVVIVVLYTSIMMLRAAARERRAAATPVHAGNA
jgi:uncharacterized membrane protein YfcA